MKINFLKNWDFLAIRLALKDTRYSFGVLRYAESWINPIWESVAPGSIARTKGGRFLIVFHWRLGPFAIGMAREAKP